MSNTILRVIKKAAILVLPILLIITLSGCAEGDAYPDATKEFFVNDFADVISKEDEHTIYSQGVALQDKTKAQAVVITVKDLDDKPISEYALEIGREWGVGDAEKNNGIVILLSESDREIYIAVGYGLEGALPDSKTGRIIDTYAIPHFSVDDFSAGITSVYNAIVNEIYIEYGIETTPNYIPAELLPETQPHEGSASAAEVIVSWIILIGLVVLYILIFGRRGGLFIFGSPRFFGSGFHFNGGFGGGSFGGFKGGGGSFGGGGAGRKF